MKIIACIKQVPDSEARVRISEEGTEIVRSGLKLVLNPYDEFAVEAGLRQKEAGGIEELLVLSVGGTESAEALRSALAMGADGALLLRTDAQCEGLTTARVIAEALREREFSLLLFGMKAIDDDLQAVGPMVAELLDLPAISAVADFSIDGQRITAEREIEGGREIVEAPIPCVLTITKGVNEPRYPTLRGIMAAKKKPLQEIPVEVGAPAVEIVSLAYPPERSTGRIVGEGPEAVPELVRLLREEARVI